jgi:hypothetical protein
MRTDLEAAEDWIKFINPCDLAEEFRQHREDAYLEERAKIVDWLRSKQYLMDADLSRIVADYIERGEHLK